MEQNREPRNEPTLKWEIMTKEVRIYNGEKTASSINGVGNFGQLHAEESNWTTLSHHVHKKIQNGSKT